MNSTGKTKNTSAASRSREKITQWWKNLSITKKINIVCIAVIAVMILTGVILFLESNRVGGEAARAAYESAKSEAAEEAYNKFYDTAFVSAERKYHVANKIAIEVAAVKEEADLEVLKVSDVEYVIESGEENENNIEAWIEFYGDGVYTVNMKASEFVIDSDRQYVLVRIPRPELTDCRITKTNRLLWKSGLFDKSYSVGTELAVEMRAAGYAKLNNYMKSNTLFYKSAKESATIIITDLIKRLNPELPDLTVEVEFVD